MRIINLILAVIVCVALMACSGPNINIFNVAREPLREYTLYGSGKNKILLIPINGTISDAPDKDLFQTEPSMVELVVAQLNKAANDEKVKTVLLEINSPGGTITASDFLYHEILSFKEKTGKKVAVAMMDYAASGGYYISLPADEIIAHPTTVTGSVGVIFLRPKFFGLMDKIGLGVDVKKFGRDKDMGSPFRESTDEEQKLMQKMVDEFGDRFVQLVQKHRHLNAESLAEVTTARVFTANEALKLGLVDKIGYLDDAINEARKIAKLTAADTRVVVYRRVEVPEDNYYNAATVSAGKSNLPLINLDLSESMHLRTGFYYLWPAAVGAE
ncbi:MAG: signal peptide peptidase SppA [Smithella sp.]|jgi:protease-4